MALLPPPSFYCAFPVDIVSYSIPMWVTSVFSLVPKNKNDVNEIPLEDEREIIARRLGMYLFVCVRVHIQCFASQLAIEVTDQLIALFSSSSSLTRITSQAPISIVEDAVNSRSGERDCPHPYRDEK